MGITAERIRMSRYAYVLGQLAAEKQEMVTSADLAALTGANPTQVRRDMIGVASGKRGVGYAVADLRAAVTAALGLRRGGMAVALLQGEVLSVDEYAVVNSLGLGLAAANYQDKAETVEEKFRLWPSAGKESVAVGELGMGVLSARDGWYADAALAWLEAVNVPLVVNVGPRAVLPTPTVEVVPMYQWSDLAAVSLRAVT